ncbi:MAG TPA: Lpp/OprI family alanine-zipper lipoprotein [Kineobactrum sp.]
MKLTAMKAISVVAFAALASGCATTAQLDEVRSTAEAAQRAANEAMQTASSAERTANEAKRTADAAMRSAEEANTKIDRAFKESMQK